MSSIPGKFSGSPQHFPDTEALSQGSLMLRLDHPWSLTAFHSPGEHWNPLFWGCPRNILLLFLFDGERRHEEVVKLSDLVLGRPVLNADPTPRCDLRHRCLSFFICKRGAMKTTPASRVVRRSQ